MTWLTAYHKEHDRYPREQRIQLMPRMAVLATEALAKAFNMNVSVECTSRTVGKCHSGTHRSYIKLPYKGCSLGMVIHELAHAYNRQRYGETGHTETFTNALSILYHHSRPLLRDILLKAKAQIQKENAEMLVKNRKMVDRQTREAERKQAERTYHESRAYKIKHLEERIKHLRSREKRIQTLIKSANRSLSHLKRYEDLAKANQAPSSPSVIETTALQTKEATQ